MATDFSFDIVSDFDRQELVNAVDQTLRELKSRYDLKNTGSEITLDEKTITILTDNEMTLEAIQDLLQTKSAKRGLSLKIFEPGAIEKAGGNRIRQEIILKKGIEQKLAKQVCQQIRDTNKKVQATIQGEAVRVSAKNKDDLQLVIQSLKKDDFPVALQFTNYR
ncbi:YajQ family cyclic di-GMP-binding protein [Candidatus Cyanaurora vandensis]|uniref:YajQ family cyclic di-GMP-binding protein n=1 Tax=Candidatus Cyanaurora vandensis TaxID=2714958 RepID=UPI00257F5BF5|nr:YajQ family cyclic di-GMP-binding protein [Candidatus Cyanaurora vandensis]